MSYEFYKMLHISSIILLVTSSLLIALLVYNPGFQNLSHLKKWLFSFHGIGALVSFVSGFGLAARINQPLSVQKTLQGEGSVPAVGWTGGIFVLLALLFLFLMYKKNQRLSFLQDRKGTLLIALIFIILGSCVTFEYWLGYKFLSWSLFILYPLMVKGHYFETSDLAQKRPVFTILFRYFLVLIVVFETLFITLFKSVSWPLFITFLVASLLVFVLYKKQVSS